MQVTTDPDHKFDLSLQLDDLDTALAITRSVPELEAETKWKALGDRALAVWRFDLARECFTKAGDLGALVLLLMATGDKEGLKSLATTAGKLSLFFGRPFYHSNHTCSTKGSKQFGVRFAIPTGRCELVY
jgi:hypothetical protein